MTGSKCVGIVAMLLAAWIVGCGGGVEMPPTVKVSGKVTLDGAPVEKGVITFEPKDGKGAPAAANIEAGQYEADVEPGSKLVRIEAPKVVGTEPVYPGDPQSPTQDKVEEQIPAQYNSNSTLEETVTADSTVNFDLKSK